MKRKQLESYLQDVSQFSHPKLELEQYPTDPHLAASVLYTAQTSFGDIEDKAVLDMGAGCGILSIGSVMLGAGSVTSLELDSDAIQDLQDNITEFEIDNIDIIQCDVTTDLVRPDFKFDTVVMNPPFGTKNNSGIDMTFLEVALSAITPSGAVYSFHKTSTRDYILNKFESKGLNIEVLAEMKFKIPHMYKQHRKKEVLVDVDFIRICGKSAAKGS